MSIEEIAHRIDDLQTKSLMAHSLQAALHVSIFYQEAFDKKDFEWAFTLLEIMASEITDELRKLTEGAFEQVQERQICNQK